MVWQYDRPEQGDGVILGFRRAASECSAMTLTPGGLQPGRRYAFTDLDTGKSEWDSGAQDFRFSFDEKSWTETRPTGLVFPRLRM